MGTKGTNKRRDQVKSSPFAGCSLVFAAMLSMLFLVGFVVWNLFKLDSEISKFTSAESIPAPVPSLLDHTKELNALKAKLNAFETANLDESMEARLALGASELNLGIAAYEAFKELRATFSVEAIKDGRLYIQISFPMRGKPMSEEFRYLNGTMVAVPRLIDSEIILEIEKVLVPEATVPDGFLGQLSPHRITERYKTDEMLGPWLAKLTGVEVVGDEMVMTVTPGVEKPLEKGTTDMKSALNRSIILFGVLVGLLAFTLAVVFFLRAKKRPLPEQLEE